MFRRLSKASAQVDVKVIGQISLGYFKLMCEMVQLTEKEAEQLVIKNSKMRVFKVHEGKINPALLDAVLETLVMSQFALSAKISRGNRHTLPLSKS